MKKNYLTPAVMVEKVEIGSLLDVSKVTGNTDIKIGDDGSDEDARSRGASGWDDEY